MVFNIEPGIYIEDYSGMRHCDMVVAPVRHAAELVVRRQRETKARKNPMARTLSGIMLEKRYCTMAPDGRCR
jgi:hypothetical protein